MSAEAGPIRILAVDDKFAGLVDCGLLGFVTALKRVYYPLPGIIEKVHTSTNMSDNGDTAHACACALFSQIVVCVSPSVNC
jgi:hypothetical protein